MHVLRSPGKTGPLDEWMVVVDGARTIEYAWRWIGPHDFGPTSTKQRTHGDAAAAQAAADAAIAAKRAAGWRPIPKWPAGTRAPIASQPAPHPFRTGTEAPFREQRFSLDGKTEIASAWKYSYGWNREGLTYKLKRHATEAAARAAIAKKAAALVADGWVPVPKWPWPPKAPKRAPVAAAPAKKVDARPDPKWRRFRVTLGRLAVAGPKVARATARELAEIERITGHAPPKDWAELVTTHGARTFAGRLTFTAANKVLAQSKKWRGWFEPEDLARHWPNLAKLAPDLAKLVLVGSTFDGDQVGYVAGASGYVLLRRDEDRAIALADLPAVLGWVNAINVGAGDRVSLRYASGR